MTDGRGQDYKGGARHPSRGEGPGLQGEGARKGGARHPSQGGGPGLQGEGVGKDQLIRWSPLALLKKCTSYTSVCLKENVEQCLPQEGAHWSSPVLSYFISTLYFG